MTLRLLLLSLVLWVGGCAKRQPDVAWVSWVFVEASDASGKGLSYDPGLPTLATGRKSVGARRRTAWEARGAVTSRRTEWWQVFRLPLKPSGLPELDWSEIVDDTEQVRQWFVDRGWVQAEVGVRTEPANLWFTKKDDTRWRRLVFEVEAGPRARLDRVEIAGDRDLPVHVRADLRRTLPPAASWTSPAARGQAADVLARVLVDHGYPFASVTPTTWGPLDRVRVRYDVDAGALRSVSEVTASGEGWIRPDLARRIADAAVPHGHTYDGERATWAIRQLEARDDIERVTVIPEAVGEDEVDVDVYLQTADRIDTKLGVEASTAGQLLGLALRFDWTVRGLGGHLASVKGFHSAGYRLFEGPPPFLVFGIQHGPTSWHGLELEGAIMPLHGVSAYVGAEGGTQTWRGWAEADVRGETGLRWSPTPTILLELFGQVGFQHHFGYPWQSETASAVFGGMPTGTGELFARAYGFGAGGARLTLDERDRGDDSDKGVALSLEAIPVGLALSQSYARMSGSLVWHAAAVPRRLTVISRLAAGVHITDDTGDNRALIGNRFFLGGPGSMRGFGFRRLGPPGANAALNEVFIGGDAMLYAGLDFRIRLHPSVDLTPFVEAGRTWASGFDKRDPEGRVVQRGIHLEDLQPVAGLGLSLHTAGRRIDGWLGVRLRNETDLADQVPRVALQLRVLSVVPTR